MSTNFVSYENAEDIFQGYADRIKANTEFVGTQAEWDALSAEDKAKYVLVNITDDNSSTGGEKEVINGYYNPADGKFYIDSSYTTEIIPDSACIYVDLNENKMYRYDSLASEYVVMSGGGGKVYVGGYGINVDNTTDEISAKTFVGTQAEWNALSPEAQEEFDSVNITDDATPIDYEPGHAIVDSTGTEAPQRSNLKFDGMTVTDDSTNDTTVVAPVPYTAGDKITITDHEIAVDETVTTTFTGTRAEWEALSATEKAAYNIVNLTDDPAGSGMVVVDVIQNGNMNAVTSNAVAEALSGLVTDILVGTVGSSQASENWLITYESSHYYMIGYYLTQVGVSHASFGFGRGLQGLNWVGTTVYLDKDNAAAWGGNDLHIIAIKRPDAP